jgi:osmoprotectant transport system permease protein
MNAIFQFITEPHNDFIGQTGAYLNLCALSIVLAIVIGVVLGVLVSRNAVLGFIAVNVCGLLRAIPVLAFLILALPYLGIGFLPALVALVVLGIPPILLNTYTGLRGIDPAMIDAAQGMGMTRWQIISRIQTPLVSPIIAAGVRTSAVQIIATATLAGLIGAGGYGNYIIDGVFKLNTTEILVGAIPVAILAMLVEVLMGQLQSSLTPAGLRLQSQDQVAAATA